MLLCHVHAHSLTCVAAPLDFPYVGDCLVAFGIIDILTDDRMRIHLLCISCLRLFGHSSRLDFGYVAVTYCHRL